MKGISLGTMKYNALREAADSLKLVKVFCSDRFGGVDLGAFTQALEAKCDELDKAGVVQHEE